MASKSDILEALRLKREDKHEQELKNIQDYERHLNTSRLLKGIKAREFCKAHDCSLTTGNMIHKVIGGVKFYSDQFMLSDKEVQEKLDTSRDRKAQIDSKYRELKQQILLHGADPEIVSLVKNW